MPQTEAPTSTTFEIKVPTDLAARMRARVHAGEFASLNDLIVHELTQAASWSTVPTEPLGAEEQWDDEDRETIARLDRGEEQTFTIEEVREHLALRRAERHGA